MYAFVYQLRLMHFSIAQCAIMHPPTTGTALMAWNNLLIIDLEGRAKQCVIEMQEYVTGKGTLEARSSKPGYLAPECT